ncbi:MurR/RpiR family transcriptional regulator [Paenibacillus chondroitinus]|uniref:MurR/RpiR family transcriptional regulator n=1 Tax=Paenibacillus chondroitinus TaxID=59842 RepID=A0ABU6D941_9BACL|nr:MULTISPECIES: MurR/RpiR family transcriptional regulator [Paenibacillus]MCY9661737.1 MurR/RpiR family transcriptional regulator [Paenibacillus anseongense]MEB4793822.1 MurR/RpiR family transcriptional regulator [Paenibacillus chondroitinus]
MLPMLKGGLVSIEAAMASLTPSERKVAQYILEHPQEVVSLSVQKLAELASVSEATIIRLSRSLHFKGFQELKMRVAGDLSQTSLPTEAYQEINANSSVGELIKSVTTNNIVSIQDTLTVLSPESVEKAIQTLSAARKIGVFGVGASGVIAEDFKQKLSRINRWCEIGTGFDAQATIAANLLPGDVVFGISYTGQTEDMIRSLAVAKKNGAVVITLTRFGANPVAELADIQLFISTLEKSIRSGAMASRIAQLNVIDILYVGIAGCHYEESVKSLDMTRQAVSVGKRNG